MSTAMYSAGALSDDSKGHREEKKERTEWNTILIQENDITVRKTMKRSEWTSNKR